MDEPYNILVDEDEKAALWVIPNFGPDLYEDLIKLSLNKEPEIIVGGKVCHQRRDVGFYSDASEGYIYSGQMAKSFSFKEAPFLQDLMILVNNTLDTNFNGALINRYRNGEKYLSAHSDSAKGLDKNNLIVAGIAYGPGVRKFRIRKKIPGKSGPIVVDHLHQPRELIIMEGEFQKRYTHEILIEKRVVEERISVTFRCHIK